MVTYAGDSPDHLRAALSSLAGQTLRAQKTCIVCAGPISLGLEDVIQSFVDDLNITRVNLPENGPLGTSLNAGLQAIDTAWVARMDSDDIAHPERFERQFKRVEAQPELDILGTATSEFAVDPKKSIGVRNVPLDQDPIEKSAFLRTPFNHMTVIYRKQSVLNVGGYKQYLGYEDFELWARMVAGGAKMANLPDQLVFARVGNGFHARRGGFKYARAEWRALSHANKINTINPWVVRATMLPRFIIRLLPTAVRNFAYRLVRSAR